MAEKIAPCLGIAPDVAYSAALLHDIGRLGLMAAYPAEYSALLQAAVAKFRTAAEFKMTEYERSIFGLDRFAAGDMAGAAVDLPKEFCALAGPRCATRWKRKWPCSMRPAVRGPGPER